MLKGKTIIELKNAVTGEVEKYEDENMVTKAIPDFFSHNIEGLLFNMNGSPNDLNGNMIPLCKNGIGGILLFADPLVEDENVYYAPSANPCTGYASNDVNSTANVMRGSLNLTESTKLDKGYKFVWDFATSQANGTISAVALTHKWGGIGYMGDAYDNTNKRWQMKSTGIDANATIRTAYMNAVEVNFTGNYMITIGLNTSNEIVIQKIRKAYRTVGLNDTMLDNQINIIEENKLTPTIFIMSNPSNNSGNYDFFDGKDGYWYGFWHDANSSGNTQSLNGVTAEVERLTTEKDALSYIASSEISHIEETRKLLSFADKEEFLDGFDGEIFETYVDRIVVKSQTELEFQMKCGLNLIERI